MPMKLRSKIEIAVATVVSVAYFGLWAFGQLPPDTPPLVHGMVGASLMAIYGDNLAEWVELRKPSGDD